MLKPSNITSHLSIYVSLEWKTLELKGSTSADI